MVSAAFLSVASSMLARRAMDLWGNDYNVNMDKQLVNSQDLPESVLTFPAQVQQQRCGSRWSVSQRIVPVFTSWSLLLLYERKK